MGLLAWGWSVAAAAASPVVEHDRAFHGTHVEHVATVTTGGEEEPAELRLHLRSSTRLDREHSMVTVSVDGVPRSTVALGEAERSSGWKVSLGALEAGAHAVKIEGRLVPLDRNCTDEMGTWMVIEEASEIEHAVVDPGIALSEIPSQWRALGEEVVIIDAVGGQAGAQASVVVDHMLRDWGVEPRHSGLAPFDDDGPRVVISELEGAPVRTAAEVDRLEKQPLALGLAAIYGHELHVVAREADDALELVERLASPELRNLCPSAVCFVSGGERPPAMANEPGDAESRSAVWSLQSKGLVGGWEVRGEGEHTLALEWSRPGSWTLERWPVLHLPIRWSGKGSWSGEAVLHVRLADRTLASYDLSEVETNEVVPIEIPIPKAWWEQPDWDVTLTVSFERNGVSRCDALDPDFPWLGLESSARLEVPRVQPKASGIAEFYRAAQSEAAPIGVVWPKVESSDQIAQVAAVLYPFSSGGPRGPGFVFHTATASRRRIFVREEPVSIDQVARHEGRGAKMLVDEVGDLGIPMLEARSVAYLWLRDRRLELVTATSPEAIVVPPLGGLGTDRALALGPRWNPVGSDPSLEVETVGVEPSAMDVGDATPAPVSIEQQQRRWIDTLWMILTLLVVSSSVVMLRWRARRALVT